jgi:hypothetical protein
MVRRIERWKGFNLHRIESWACIVTKIEEEEEEEEEDDDDDYGDED